MHCADIVAMPSYISGNSAYICHLDLKNMEADKQQKNNLLVNEKGDVGMAKCYKKYGNKG